MISDIEDMAAIIGLFLDFAREGGNEPSSAGEDLNHIVSSVCERFCRSGQVIRTQFGELPFMTMKPIAMQRMVTNLVDNALRYGGDRVEVTTEHVGGTVILRVLDRGPGIPDQELSHVMQPFTRLESSRSGAGGSGLGLAIVERTAHIHGGTVQLLRRSGGGLEARVELPIVPVKGEANQSKEYVPSTV
jgi:two-component system osmolarity sensor histidine kinase EnvZ